MIRSALIVGYILLVLLISGLSRAETKTTQRDVNSIVELD